MKSFSGPDNMTPYSSLTTAIQLNKSNLIKLLNQQVDSVINGLAPQPMELGNIIVKKEGALDIGISGTQINLEIPLTLHFQGEQLLSSLKAQAGIRLFIKSDIDLKPYWQLTTKTELERYLWLDEPDIQLSRLKIPVERLADQLLEKNKEKLEQQIDRAIAKYWSDAEVDKIAEAFFSSAHQLQPDLPFYLRLLPEKIHIAPALNEAVYIQSILYNKLQIEITSNLSSVENSPLPSPSFSEPIDSKDLCYINVLLEYAAIEQLLQKWFIGQSFSYRNYSLKTDALSVKRTTDYIEITVHTSGSLDGLIHIEGMPQYDEQTNNLTMNMHHFQIKTDSFWKQSVAKLLTTPIKNAIEEKLQYNLDDILKQEAVKKLKNFSPAPEVVAGVNPQSIQLSNFIVGKEALTCLLIIQGESKLTFGDSG